MKRRHIEWQIRAIRVMYEAEGARLTNGGKREFRARAIEIVDRLTPVPMDDDLRRDLVRLREELLR